MSNSTETPGSLINGSSTSPPPSSKASPPPPLALPPPSMNNADSSPPPPPSESAPPPSSSLPPPSSSKSSPPLVPSEDTNNPPSNSGAPESSTPPPPTSTSPTPKSMPTSPPPSPTPPTPTSSSSNSPPPPPSQQVSSPPPPTTTSSPPMPLTVSPPASSSAQSPTPPTGFVTPPSPPISGATPTPSNNPPSPPGTPQTPPLSISPPPSGSAQSGNTSKASTGTKNDSKASSNSTAQASVGSGNISSTPVVVGVVVASALLISLIAIFFFFIRRRNKKKEASYPHYLPPKSQKAFVNGDGFFYEQQQQNTMGFSGPANFLYGHVSLKGNTYTGPDSGVLGASTAFINYEQVVEITNGFSHQNIIGEGGFGSVYKGWMPDGKVVAVKQLKAGSGQGDREFKAEVEIISRVHHRHLVSLVGYCVADNQRLLIYEFVPNKTLEHHLHSNELQALDWTKRLKIAIGSAKGLAYLHEDCHPKIIHRDIKSANILLDNYFEAQVADFGLARMNDTTQTHVSTRVMGTFGYLAPEYASSGKLTDRSDVFSFGVVLLELITGRKPVDPTRPLGDESLVEWARPILVRALETGDVSELVDPRLQNHYVESEMLRMVETAAACVRHSATKRPRMVQVVRSLDSEGELSDLSNGVKYGQSTVYDSDPYNEDIMKFRKMALGGQDSLEFDAFSGDDTASHSSAMPSSSEYTR